MRFHLLQAAGLSCVLLLASGASADVTFDLNNVELVPGVNGTADAGTLSGNFVVNNALSSLVSADITASPGSGGGNTYIGADYIYPAATTNNSSLPIFLDLTIGTGATADELRLTFTSDLTASGATLSNSSFENEPLSGGDRTVSVGSVVPATVPEPAALSLLTALLPLGLSRLRRRR